VLTTPADLYAMMRHLMKLGYGTAGVPAPTGVDVRDALRFSASAGAAVASGSGSDAAPLPVDEDGDTRGQSWSRMESLIEKKLPLDRSCADAGIPSMYCLCLVPTDLDVKSEPVRAYAQAAIAHAAATIDALKAEEKELCHPLELESVVEATEQIIDNVAWWPHLRE
jgi:hypothetical protein